MEKDNIYEGKVVKMFVPCKYCENNTGIILFSGPHKKLICNDCHKYIKFLNKDDIKKLKGI